MIWKTPDVKPKNFNDIVCMVGDMFFIGCFDKYQGLYKSRGGTLYNTDEIDRWGYLEDIIAQADKAERLQMKVDVLEPINDSWTKYCEQKIKQIQRLQKALDLIANMEQRLCIDDPVDILDDVLKIAKNEIKQLIKGE